MAKIHLWGLLVMFSVFASAHDHGSSLDFHNTVSAYESGAMTSDECHMRTHELGKEAAGEGQDIPKDALKCRAGFYHGYYSVYKNCSGLSGYRKDNCWHGVGHGLVEQFGAAGIVSCSNPQCATGAYMQFFEKSNLTSCNGMPFREQCELYIGIVFLRNYDSTYALEKCSSKQCMEGIGVFLARRNNYVSEAVLKSCSKNVDCINGAASEFGTNSLNVPAFCRQNLGCVYSFYYGKLFKIL